MGAVSSEDQTSDEVRYPGAGVTGGSELPNVGAGD